MRIAFLANADNIHTRRWAEFLAGRGHEMHLLCDPPADSPPRGARLIHPEMNLLTKILAFKLFPRPYGNNFYKRFPYRRELDKLNPDIVHGFEALGYGYALASAGPRVKILTPWGNDILHDARRSAIARFLVTRALRSADVITTNCPGLDIYLKKEFQIPERKIRPFSWGVDLTVFHAGHKDAAARRRAELGIPPDAPVILSPRMMKPYWGIRVIAKALQSVMNQKRDVRAVFIRGAGDATFEEEIRTGFAASGLSGRVHFIAQYLSEKEVAEFFNMADAFVSCPESDLLSITLLEGMACGCAPVLAELEAYKSRILHGKNGLFFPPGDSAALANRLMEFLSHLDLKDRFAGENARIIREKDDWRRNALLMEDIYREALERRGRHRNGGGSC